LNDAVNAATDTPEVGVMTDNLVNQVLEEAGIDVAAMMPNTQVGSL
jgi:hypothetical protein